MNDTAPETIYTPEWQERLRQYYDRPAMQNYWAFNFDRVWAKHKKGVEGQKTMARLVSNWMNLDNASVLVIGSYLGAEPIAYALCGAKVVGIDLDEEALELSRELAQRYGTDIEVHCMDGAETNFPDSSFDYISCAQVLEHLPPERQPVMMKEIWRLLKPGGLVWIDTPNQWSFKDSHDTGLPLIHWLPRSIKIPLARKLGRSVSAKEPGFDFETVHLHYYLSYFQLRRILKDLGPHEILSIYRGFGNMDQYRAERQRQGRGKGLLFEAKVILLKGVFRIWNHSWFNGIRLMIHKDPTIEDGKATT